MHCSKAYTMYYGCNDKYSRVQGIKIMDWCWNSREYIKLIFPPKLGTNSDIDVKETKY